MLLPLALNDVHKYTDDSLRVIAPTCSQWLPMACGTTLVAAFTATLRTAIRLL
jgi:hypothetical protein